MPTLTIDGRTLTVPPGTSVFNACKQAGIYVPNYCYHPGLSVAGVCRICMVDIKGQPKPAISCNTPCADNMEVFTQSEKARKARKGVMEFLLVNHPLDCPTCDQAGECELQDFAAKENQLSSRFEEDKILKARENFGPHVQYVPNRCILCTRCVRFGEEISGIPSLGIVQRGAHAEIALYPGAVLDDEMASNVVDVCPVGALLARDSLHQGRAWFLKRTPSTCPSCSRGCSVTVDSFRDEVTRLRPRHNPKVNDYWICDAGRYHTDFIHRKDRLLRPMRKGSPVSWEEALRSLQEKRGSLMAVGSAWATTEENYLLALAAGSAGALLCAPDGPARTFKSGFKIDSDKNPNRSGARAALRIDESVNRDFWARAGSGEVAGALLLDTVPGYTPSGEELAGWRKAPFKGVLGILPSAWTQEADLVLPVACWAETAGTFVNAQGHVQWIRPSVKPPGQARDAWRILAEVSGVAAGEIAQVHALLPAGVREGAAMAATD